MFKLIRPTLLGMLVFATLTTIAFAQTPTQIKEIIPTTASITFQWDYDVSNEALIDDFVLQRTAFAATSTITSPYDVQVIIPQKTIRTFTLPTPAGVTAGQTAFFRIIARKVGLADSQPSNVVQVKVVAAPPSPFNLRFP